MSILEFLLKWMGKRGKPGPRVYEIDEGLQMALSTLARQEGRPERELVPELLSTGLSRYRSLEELWAKWESLTPRERDIVALTCLGLTNRQIAAKLSLSPDTVKTHIRNVLFKFGVNSKLELRQILDGWDFGGWI